MSPAEPPPRLAGSAQRRSEHYLVHRPRLGPAARTPAALEGGCRAPISRGRRAPGPSCPAALFLSRAPQEFRTGRYALGPAAVLGSFSHAPLRDTVDVLYIATNAYTRRKAEERGRGRERERAGAGGGGRVPFLSGSLCTHGARMEFAGERGPRRLLTVRVALARARFLPSGPMSSRVRGLAPPSATCALPLSLLSFRRQPPAHLAFPRAFLLAGPCLSPSHRLAGFTKIT